MTIAVCSTKALHTLLERRQAVLAKRRSLLQADDSRHLVCHLKHFRPIPPKLAKRRNRPYVSIARSNSINWLHRARRHLCDLPLRPNERPLRTKRDNHIVLARFAYRTSRILYRSNARKSQSLLLVQMPDSMQRVKPRYLFAGNTANTRTRRKVHRKTGEDSRKSIIASPSGGSISYPLTTAHEHACESTASNHSRA